MSSIYMAGAASDSLCCNKATVPAYRKQHQTETQPSPAAQSTTGPQQHPEMERMLHIALKVPLPRHFFAGCCSGAALMFETSRPVVPMELHPNALVLPRTRPPSLLPLRSMPRGCKKEHAILGKAVLLLQCISKATEAEAHTTHS